jgi:hypothetical protein
MANPVTESWLKTAILEIKQEFTSNFIDFKATIDKDRHEMVEKRIQPFLLDASSKIDKLHEDTVKLKYEYQAMNDFKSEIKEEIKLIKISLDLVKESTQKTTWTAVWATSAIATLIPFIAEFL